MHSIASKWCSRFIVNKYVIRMSSKLNYEEAVQKLNNLQSNLASLKQIRLDIHNGKGCTNIEDMEKYLYRIGISLDELDKLSVIHVAGTKGKGSTSAMCESILRTHGYKTGFYSSPHLVAVCERIRLNGQTIDKDKFAKYFDEVYNKLDCSQDYEGDMPKYFAFMTVLAFHIFLKEKLDVAIVEVGIGGTVDYTNVLRKVPVVGITALGLDHTSILGNTIELIAEAKAGIMKPGCEAYTVPQPQGAMEVLYRVAKQNMCHLHVVPEYKSYKFPVEYKPQLPVNLAAYQMNASLAIQLSHAWMRNNMSLRSSRKNSINKQLVYGKVITQNSFSDIDTSVMINNKKNGQILNNMLPDEIPIPTVIGLEKCRWPGRYQKVNSDYAQFFLDGAHTKESIQICAHWFKQQTRNQDKVLIFSATGDRDAELLLHPLKDICFVKIYFVVPTAFREANQKNDNYSIMEHNELVTRCQRHAMIWESIHGKTDSSNVIVLDCVSDALKHVKQHSSGAAILITGSLHLVGAALSILVPNLSSL